MNQKTLFLAWQDKRSSRQWFPVGRLDADVLRRAYRFRYTRRSGAGAVGSGVPTARRIPGTETGLQSGPPVSAVSEPGHQRQEAGSEGLPSEPRSRTRSGSHRDSVGQRWLSCDRRLRGLPKTRER